MVDPDGSLRFYFFDIDDNLFFLPTNLYLWNAERRTEQPISSDDFARIQNDLGRAGKWQARAVREETFCNLPRPQRRDRRSGMTWAA
jgi:hypothetical protein